MAKKTETRPPETHAQRLRRTTSEAKAKGYDPHTLVDEMERSAARGLTFAFFHVLGEHEILWLEGQPGLTMIAGNVGTFVSWGAKQ